MRNVLLSLRSSARSFVPRIGLAGLAGLALAALLPLSAPAAATPITDGEFVTYDQNIWGADPADGPPSSMLQAHFFDVYTAAVGYQAVFGNRAPGGFTMSFDAPNFLLDYLPQGGAPSALNYSVSDPNSTAAGVFGGQVVALGLNIDFADAGLLSHPASISFGDLILAGFTGTLVGLNGQTVRQLEQAANVLLGGGAEPFSIQEMSTTLNEVNESFEGGFVSTYGQAHFELPAETIPEPSTLPLAALSMVALVMQGRRKRTASI